MTIRDLLLARAEQDTPALLTHERTWTWRELVADASARAAAVERLLDPQRPPHVGLLMDNTPEMLLGLAAAGLGGQVAVGVNSTRRGDALVADLHRADVQLLLTDATQSHLLDGLDLGEIQVVELDETTFRQVQGPVVEPVETTAPAPTDDSLFMLIFTSGTSGRPKAVRITHEKVTYPGQYLSERFGLTADDVHYIAMPLFHSNAVMAGWAPALVNGAAVALREKFSASEFLADVRRFGATYASYVGKPLTYVLATPERPDDAENSLRLLFGNEAGDRDTRAFAERFGCMVVDGFGSTENAVIVSRIEGTPPGSLGWPFDGVAVLDPETGEECPRAELDATGRVVNLDECVGELVNTAGAGQFAGYYNDEEAMAERMRGGMYWSGDLAYRDADGWVYFAGRTAAWLRVDGENLACAPIERVLLRHPAIDQAAVYAVPDERSGDQVAAALVLRGDLDPDDLERSLDEQQDLSPKARPRYVRVVDDLPRTATNKMLHRELTAAGLTGITWTREERESSYHPIRFVPCDAQSWHDPWRMYAELRDHDPVHHVRDGDYWVLSRHDDVYAAARDHETFSSAQGLTFEYDELERIGLEDNPPMVMTDPPTHTDFRQLVSRGFTPRQVESIEPAVREFVVDRVERLRADGGGDIVAQLFKPLPSMVVAHYLGVPKEDWTTFDRWTDAIVAAGSNQSYGSSMDAVSELMAYFTDLIARRRNDPGEDTVSHLVMAGEGDDDAGILRILAFTFTMVTGGNDTSTGLLGGAVQLLGDRPDQRALVLDDVPASVEELLRLTSPVQGLARTVTRDVTLHGTTIPAGRKVLLSYAAANRDPRMYGPDADELDVRRSPRQILTFSHGAHHCLGAAAARMMGRVALTELLQRIPDFVVDPDSVRWAPGPYVRRPISAILEM